MSRTPQIIISHRGNLTGPGTCEENSPISVDRALELGFDVEVDLWCVEGQLYLGHDYAKYPISESWLKLRFVTLWVHCKNLEAVEWAMRHEHIHFFWHDEAPITLTSKGYVWVHPLQNPIANSIHVLPETLGHFTTQCGGVCTDYPIRYSS